MSDHGSQQQPRPAYCEEYSEETQATLSDTRQSASVTAKRSANVSNKSRSGRDEQSDSGYSSHTHSAPNSSLDSRIDANQPPPPPPPPPTAPAAAAVPVPKPEKSTKLPKSRAHSPEKNVLRRAGSKSRRDGDSRKNDCMCDKCVSDPRRSAVPVQPNWLANYAIAQPRQKTPAPPSPQPRRPALVEPIMVPREHARPRPSASRARPMSFHAGTLPEPRYLAQPHYIMERQPSMRQPAYPFPPQAFPPPQPYVEQMLPLQSAPPLPPPQNYYPQPTMAPMAYEIVPQPRPRPRRLTSEQTRARPQSMYYGSPPIYEYVEPTYKTIEPKQPIQRQLSRRGRRESLRTSEPSSHDEANLMPPPPVPKPPKPETRVRTEQRPHMRQTASAAAVYPSQTSQLRGGSGQDPSESSLKRRDSRKGNTEESSRSRHPSKARPARPGEEKAVTFDDVERDMSRMDLDASPAKSRRRSSVYGHESLADAEGSIEAYQQSVRTPAALEPSKEDVIARLMREKRANSLQQHKSEDGGSRLSAQSRGSRGSKSSRDGSERVRHPSISESKALDRRPSNDVGSVRSTETNDAPFALRFKPQDTNVTMAGSIDGRAISLRRSKEVDGDIELSIESHAAYDTLRGRKPSTSSGRPPLRQHSHKRYSYIEGQGVREITGPGYESSQAVSMARVSSQQSDEQVPRIVGERIVTTTRSRRSSRYGYDGRDRYDYEGRERYER